VARFAFCLETKGMATVDKKPPLLVDFGECVRRHRIERGHSQEAFADLCEIDRSYMGGVERGERNLSLANIARIIQALELEPSVFFRGIDSDSRAAMRARRESENERRQLLAKVKALPSPKVKKPIHAL
jgi:transcriptional regulator with XRE-family HTH domain